MFGKFERTIAFRYLRAKKQGFISVISWFSMLGIMLGVATLIIVMSVMNGFRQELLSRILGMEGHIEVHAAKQNFSNYKEIEKKISTYPQVDFVLPVIKNQALISLGDNVKGVLVRGIELNDFKKYKLLNPLVSGNINEFTGIDKVIISYKVARLNGLYIGDTIKIITPSRSSTAFGNLPKSKTLKIVGLFDSGVSEYDNNVIFIPLKSAQLLFGYGDGIGNLEIFTHEPDSSYILMKNIKNDIGSEVGQLYNWTQTRGALVGALQTERNVMFLILTLIILIAGFNIISGMIMLVKDKTKDIAILRTMGATRGMILRAFLLLGSSIGVVGVLLGCVLGILFCNNIEKIRRFIESITGGDLFSAELYYLSTLPSEVDNIQVMLIIFIALLISFLAPLYPAYKASKLSPAEALRYE